MSVSTAPAGESLTVGSPVKLSVLPVRPNTRGNYNVSSDGRFLVLVSSEEVLTSPLTVIVNWVPGLK